MRLIFSLLIIFNFLCIQENGYAGWEEKTGTVKNYDKAKEYYGYAENYERQALQYEEKSRNSSGEQARLYKELAQNYYESAVEKKRMAKAYQTGDKQILDEAFKRYKDLTSVRCKIQKDIEGFYNKDKSYKFKKDYSYKEKQKNYKK